MFDSITIRLAGPADAQALRAMQATSLRVLGAAVYSRRVIEAYLSEVATLDDPLLRDGRYRVATADGAIVGCGGWSTRPAGYDAIASAAAHASAGAATVRAVYVRPDWARRGVARRIMAVAEADMAANGISRAELMSTLSGLAFYQRLGYAPGGSVALRLRGGLALQVVEMRKDLVASPAAAA